MIKGLAMLALKLGQSLQFLIKEPFSLTFVVFYFLLADRFGGWEFTLVRLPVPVKKRPYVILAIVKWLILTISELAPFDLLFWKLRKLVLAPQRFPGDCRHIMSADRVQGRGKEVTKLIFRVDKVPVPPIGEDVGTEPPHTKDSPFYL
jgi:hypothetical protein